jgi:hypothetical protein
LGWQASATGIASGYIDPVAKIAAQDEAVYSSTSIGMAGGRGWLTPMFLGRYVMYKPPLLYWLSGISIRFFGVGPLQLRLPSVLTGAAIAAAVFYWALQIEGLVAAIGAVFLLSSNYLWYTLGSLNMTDMLLTCCIVMASLCLHVNPELGDPRAFFGFGIAVAAALMTKGVAGVVPILIFAGTCVLLRARPPFKRIVQLAALVAALALPWYLYQLVVHHRWFWAEFVLMENLSYGLGAPPQTTNEGQIAFYARRLWTTDFPLLCLALASVPFWWRRANRDRAILLSWIATMLLTVAGFHYRNASYLLPLVPALCLWACPVLRWKPVSLLLVPAILIWKGVPFEPGTTVASAPILKEYCRQGRSAQLIVVAPDDEFYSAVLPLSGVHYLYFQTSEPSVRPALDFQKLGITVSADQFNDLAKWTPVFHARLREWGLDSETPVATVILAKDREQVEAVIRNHPDYDFLLPAELVPAGGTHLQRSFTDGRTLLLSPNKQELREESRTCEM